MSSLVIQSEVRSIINLLSGAQVLVPVFFKYKWKNTTIY